jgi:hypothetical protein
MRDGDRLNNVFFALGLAAAAVSCVWYAYKSWRDGRVIRDTPTSRVRSAAQGYVELDGRGELPPGVETRAPLTRLPCTWWSFRIEEAESRRGSSSWNVIERGTSNSLFFLDDGTGRVLIDPRGAQVFASEKSVWYGSSRTPGVRPLDNPSLFGRVFDRVMRGNFRYTEHRMSVGAPLYAIGAFRSVGGVSSVDVDAATAQLLRDWKRDQSALLKRFDTDGDGNLSIAEWEAARAQARAQVQRTALDQPVPPRMNVLSQPGDGRSFLLASSDASSLARRFWLRSLGGVACFLVALVWLTWMLEQS